MSETILTALISAAASLIVAFGTWHVSMKKDREKQTDEVMTMLTNHREEYLREIRSVQEDITQVNATVQQQIALIEQKIDIGIEQKIDTLSERVDRHNNLIERTYRLEELTQVHSEKISVANHRIDDLEKKTS